MTRNLNSYKLFLMYTAHVSQSRISSLLLQNMIQYGFAAICHSFTKRLGWRFFVTKFWGHFLKTCYPPNCSSVWVQCCTCVSNTFTEGKHNIESTILVSLACLGQCLFHICHQHHTNPSKAFKIFCRYTQNQIPIWRYCSEYCDIHWLLCWSMRI